MGKQIAFRYATFYNDTVKINLQEDSIMKLATAAQMRETDRKAIEERGIPSIDLMERAAEGIAAAAMDALPERAAKCQAAVFCGSGNNGGDGIAAVESPGGGSWRGRGDGPMGCVGGSGAVSVFGADAAADL